MHWGRGNLGLITQMLTHFPNQATMLFFKDLADLTYII